MWITYLRWRDDDINDYELKLMEVEENFSKTYQYL